MKAPTGARFARPVAAGDLPGPRASSSWAPPASWARSCSACCCTASPSWAGPTSWCGGARAPAARTASGTASSPRRRSIPCARPTAGAEGLAAFLRDKVRVVDGDITEPNLGLSEEEAAAVAEDIDVLINSSGKVTFNPPLESALRTNVEGTKNVIAFARRMKRPGADPHQHLLRGRQPLGRGLGGRGAGRLLPALARAARHQVLGRAGDGRQRAHRRRGAGPGRRRPGAGPPAPAGPRPPARGGPRPRRRGGAASWRWPASARSGSARS